MTGKIPNGMMVGHGIARKATALGLIGSRTTGARRIGMEMMEAENAGEMTQMLEAEATGTAGKKMMEAENAGEMTQMLEAEATGTAGKKMMGVEDAGKVAMVEAEATGTAGKKVMEVGVAGTAGAGKIQAQMMEAEVTGVEAAGMTGVEMMVEAEVIGTAQIGKRGLTGKMRMDSRHKRRSGRMIHGPAGKMMAMAAAAAHGTAGGEAPALVAEKRSTPQTDALSQSSPAAVLPLVQLTGPRVGSGRRAPISMGGRMWKGQGGLAALQRQRRSGRTNTAKRTGEPRTMAEREAATEAETAAGKGSGAATGTGTGTGAPPPPRKCRSVRRSAAAA